jgi:hypothetical protein
MILPPWRSMVLASAYGIWSMPPTGWNMSIAWSQPNSKEK